MKKAFLVFFCLFTLLSFSQRINEYEYVIIPEKFQFQRSPHEYQLNALLKCQLEEYGFKAFYSSELANLRPEDRCLFVNANVLNVSNIFLFKVMIEFTDCNNAVVYQSEIGGSKDKDRYDAFNEALDGALKTVKLAKYNFEGVRTNLVFNNQDDVAVGAEPKIKNQEDQAEQNKIAQAKIEQDRIAQEKANQYKIEEAKNLKTKSQQNTVAKVVPQKKKKGSSSSTGAKKSTVSASVAESNSVAQTPVLETKVAEVKTEVVKVVENAPAAQSQTKLVAEKKDSLEGISLYAQAIENGFQFVDTTPKIVLKLEKTLQYNYFNANKKNGVVYMKNGGWIFEYFLDGELIVEKLNVKFCD